MQTPSTPQYNRNLYVNKSRQNIPGTTLYDDPQSNNAPGLVVNAKNVGRGLKWDGTTLSAKNTVGIVAQSATPAINTNSASIFSIVGIAQAITSMTSKLSGTPDDADMMMIQLTDNGTPATISWGASFESTTVTLPATTVASTMLRVLLQWNKVAGKWDCIAVA